MERELQSTTGDEPGLCIRNSTVKGANIHSFASANATIFNKSNNATSTILSLECQDGTNSDYVPTVGRWGAEWPSWLDNVHNTDYGYGLGSVLPQYGGGLTDPASHIKHVTTNKLPAGASSSKRPISKWVGEDGYNLASFNQTVGAWQPHQPLPLPQWMPKVRDPLVTGSIWQYEDIVGVIETLLQRMLEETYYDTVHNFLNFHQAFRRSDTKNLHNFFKHYDIPINRRHHMCVSLAMEIIARVSEIYPEMADRLYLVSCEEAVEDSVLYAEHCEESGIEQAAPNLEKEHALVAMRVIVAGREGILIIDPGYHVARAVTVMKDQCYPHTGWFTQNDEPGCKREYSYIFSAISDKFVEWHERCTRGDKVKFESSIVFVDRPYMTAVDVTVRRNLVYNFRSLLARDAKGRVRAGIYFPIPSNPNDTQITLFYEGGNEQSVKVKYRLSIFSDTSRLPHSLKLHLESLAPQLRFELDDLTILLKQCSDALSDFDFVKQVLLINTHISELSVDNWDKARQDSPADANTQSQDVLSKTSETSTK